MTSKLEQLKQFTDVVADTGDIEAIRLYKPLDATTNPSLVYKAAQMPQYQDLLQSSIKAAKSITNSAEQLSAASDNLAVGLGLEILKLVPGRISTEVDARLSFDTKASIAKARHLIDLYAKGGADKSRVLIKLASTWEGIRAAEVLEKEGIKCAFGVPGAAINPFYSAMKARGSIRWPAAAAGSWSAIAARRATGRRSACTAS